MGVHGEDSTWGNAASNRNGHRVTTTSRRGGKKHIIGKEYVRIAFYNRRTRATNVPRMIFHEIVMKSEDGRKKRKERWREQKIIIEVRFHLHLRHFFVQQLSMRLIFNLQMKNMNFSRVRGIYFPSSVKFFNGVRYFYFFLQLFEIGGNYQIFIGSLLRDLKLQLFLHVSLNSREIFRERWP